MRILLDCDGPLADWVGGLLSKLAEEGHPVPTPDMITQWDFFGLLETSVATRAREICTWPEFWRTLPVTPGARDGVSILHEAGHEIFVVTSPYWSCPAWENSRRWWLLREFGVHPECMISTSAKYLVRGDILIDDKPEHLQAWARETQSDGVPVLFSMPHNTGATLVPPLKRMCWTDIIQTWG